MTTDKIQVPVNIWLLNQILGVIRSKMGSMQVILEDAKRALPNLVRIDERDMERDKIYLSAERVKWLIEGLGLWDVSEEDGVLQAELKDLLGSANDIVD